MKRTLSTAIAAALLLTLAAAVLPSPAAAQAHAETNKRIYRSGEPVEITFTTVTDLSHGPISSWISIYRLRPAELVKGWGCYVTWVYYLAGTFDWTWDQTVETYDGCDPTPETGEQVPPGLYVATTPGGWTLFYILPPDVPGLE